MEVDASHTAVVLFRWRGSGFDRVLLVSTVSDWYGSFAETERKLYR